MNLPKLDLTALCPIPVDQLRWQCSTDTLLPIIEKLKQEKGEDGSNLDHLKHFMPKQARKAIKLALAMDAPGYNVFVSGPTGSGKTSAIKQLLKNNIRPKRPRYDFLYIHNFDDADRPHLCKLPQGQGKTLKRRLIHFVEAFPEVIMSALHSTRLKDRRRNLMRQLEDALNSALEQLQASCEELGFVFIHSEEDFGASEIQIKVGRRKVISIEHWVMQVNQGKRKGKVEEKIAQHESLTEHLHSLWDDLSRIEWDLHRHIAEIEVNEIRERLAIRTDSLFFEQETPDLSDLDHDEETTTLYDEVNIELARWFEGLIDWVDDHLEELKQLSSEPNLDLKDLRILKANLIHEAPKTPPIIFERTPTLINLLGTIERSGEDTHPHLDFGDIRSGSLLRANGGILVLNANDLSLEGASTWRFLLKALKHQKLEIQSPDQLFASGGSPIKPTSIPLDVKVIAIGDDELFRALFVSNEDFGRVFKIKAEFDDTLINDTSGLKAYLGHALRVQIEEGFKPFSPEALTLWCEYGTRLSGRQKRLSTQLSQLTDILREAGHYAHSSDQDSVSLEDLREALNSRFDRHKLIEDHLFEMIEDSLIELSPFGESVGLIHGLTVLDFGDHACGHPCRISATHAPGEFGVMSIEREVRLSGRSHDKGAMNVAAYLRAHYLPNLVSALHATLCFDQVHDEVDGDSASLAELLALISSLSQTPLKQSIAVTGAIDQRGNVQAIGGVNEKIEGFFRLCQHRGLNGDHGVIIPKSILNELSLKSTVLEAVKQGKFSLWAIDHVDQAITILTHSKEALTHLTQDEVEQQRSEIKQAVSTRLKELSMLAAQYLNGDITAYK
jgi:predicted ATP-dependent protease